MGDSSKKGKNKIGFGDINSKETEARLDDKYIGKYTVYGDGTTSPTEYVNTDPAAPKGNLRVAKTRKGTPTSKIARDIANTGKRAGKILKGK